MQSNKTFSVSQLSKTAGISVRTLHHYDQTGLLNPRRRQDNGYREYTVAHLHKLQQILIYRELDFTLDDIKKILASDDSERAMALSKQKDLLIEKRAQLQGMIATIEQTISQLNSNDNFEYLFAGLPKEKAEQWQQTTRDRVGGDAFERMMQKAASKLTPQQAKAMNVESMAISKDMSVLLDQPVSDNAVQAVVKRHYDMLVNMFSQLSQEFEGLTRDSYSQLAIQFLTIEEMKAARDHFAKGTAEHLSEGMIYFAQRNLD